MKNSEIREWNAQVEQRKANKQNPTIAGPEITATPAARWRAAAKESLQELNVPEAQWITKGV